MDYHALIEEMEKTGRPVSARIDIADDVKPLDGSNTPVTHQTIDVTPAAPSSCWPNVPAIVALNPPQEDPYAPTRRHIYQCLDRRRKAALPDSIATKRAALFFLGLVNYAVLYQTNSERLETITRALGGSAHDVDHWKHPHLDHCFVEWAMPVRLRSKKNSPKNPVLCYKDFTQRLNTKGKFGLCRILTHCSPKR